MSTKFKLFTVLVSITVISGVATPSMANIEIKEVRWGFNNKVMRTTFVPMSVLIDNPTEKPFERQIQLQRFYGNVARGALYVEQVYIGPFSQKWVQFYPYIRPSQDDWELRWANERYEIETSPAFGPPARVLLIESGSLRSTSTLRQTFPADLFPATATATDTLDVVFLDHVPAWQQAQRRAFMDWLYVGGTVHLFHETEGSFPKFVKEMAKLNSPLDRMTLGSGLVIRHDFPREKITNEMADRWTKKSEDANSRKESRSYTESGLDRDTDIFRKLRQMTQPKHNWVVIFLLGGVYLLLIFPGGFILGFLRTDYRIIYGGFLALAIVFSVAFNFIGSRGYGETTTVNHVAIARPLDNGRFDVMQWSNVFVTEGDDYLIKHHGSGALYSTCQDGERVRHAEIDSGVNGLFTVDIPIYSNRPFGNRMQVKLKQPINLKVELWESDDNYQLENLVVIVDESFPKNPRKIEVLYGNFIHYASFNEGRLVASRRGAQSVTSRIQADATYVQPYYMSQPQQDVSSLFSEIYPILRLADLQRRQSGHLNNFRLSEDRARIYVYADMPQEFLIDNTELGSQTGCVLFVLDVLNPEQQ